MNPMTDERRRTTRAWWDSKKGAYPFHAQAPMMEPTPTDVALALGGDIHGYGYFVAAPVGDGLAYWGFKTAAGRDAFLERFPQATELTAEAVFGNPV